MALPQLTLTTNKRDFLFIQPLVLRSGEKGITVQVTVTDPKNQPYDLTGKKLFFEEQKSKHYVSDSEATTFKITNATAGKFEYTLPAAALMASGEAWFRIQSVDGAVIDTTQTFDIKIAPGLNLENDKSYVSALTVAIEQSNALLAQLKKTVDDAGGQMDDFYAVQKAAIIRWKTDTLAELETALNQDKVDFETELNNVKSEQTAKYQALLEKIQGTLAEAQTTADKVNALLESIPTDPKYKGPKGDPGKDGKGLQIDGSADSVDTLPADSVVGTTYLVDNSIYTYDGAKWNDCGKLQGPAGADGVDGKDGDSAYQVWLDNGHEGTVDDFIASLKGDPGKDGTDGQDGASAYQVWLDDGHEGTVDDFIASLKVDPGKVAHLSGANNFDTVPTVNNIPLLLAKAPGIPKLAVTYNATSKAFEYTLTAPDKDGLSDIIQYNLMWKDHSVDGWTTAIVKPDSLTGQLTGVEITKTYDFKATAQNAVGSSDSTDVITVLAVEGNIYGVSWDGSSSGVLQRTDAAVGLKAGINGAQNDFDTRAPWGLMDKTVTDSYGNAFVRVPKFYIRKTQNKSLSTWQVSMVKQGDDWYLPKCFYDFDTKKELDYVDVSRYEGSIVSGKLQSKTGVMPTGKTNINDFRTSATALNVDGKKGYHLWDVHTLDVLQVLFTIEFATLDSQSIMEGNDHSSDANITGTTDSVKGSSGFVTSGPASMVYRGIENLYGNLAMLTDGLNISDLSLYSCDDATKYVSDTFMYPYYKVSYPLISGYGNITGLGFDKEHPGVTAPTSFNSDELNTYYHDKGSVAGSGIYAVYTGGGFNFGTGSPGLWYWNGNNSSSDVVTGVGSRLLKKAL